MTEISKLVKKAKVGMLLIAFISLVQAPAQTVYAGEINSEETRLIELIQQTFTYEGKTYQVSDSYIEMTKAYLMEDDVDFTAGEVDQLLSKIKSNVATGVAEGYLYEVGLDPDNSEDEVTTIEEGQGEEEIKEEGEQQDPQGDLDEEDISKSEQDNQNVTSNLEDKKENEELKETNTQENGKTQEGKTQVVKQEEVVKQEDSSVDMNTSTQKIDKETIDDQSKNEQAEENGKNDNQVVDGIIKNTGFCINATIIMGGAILFFLIIGVTIAHRVSQFANDDDE